MHVRRRINVDEASHNRSANMQLPNRVFKVKSSPFSTDRHRKANRPEAAKPGSGDRPDVQHLAQWSCMALVLSSGSRQLLTLTHPVCVCLRAEVWPARQLCVCALRIRCEYYKSPIQVCDRSVRSFGVGSVRRSLVFSLLLCIIDGAAQCSADLTVHYCQAQTHKHTRTFIPSGQYF